MFRNYLKIAYRNIVRNKTYSFINVLGLSVGIAASIFIFLWVHDELSWDGFHKNKQQIYQVMMRDSYEGGISTQTPLPFALAKELQRTIPDVQYAVETDWGGDKLLSFEDKKITGRSYFVGEHFLEVFSFDLIKGSESKVFEDPNSVVLTESKAFALFGQEDPLNKVLLFNNTHPLKVTGIVKDIPTNSTFQFDLLVPFSFFVSTNDWMKEMVNNFSNNSYQVFVQLKEGAAEDLVNRKISNVSKHNDPEVTGTLFLHPISKWRLYSKFENGEIAGGRIEFVRIFMITAIFIILIACINFMNLATAMSEKRAKEVGVRKVIGLGKKELIFQFLTESIAVTTIAFTIAVFLVHVLLPNFNTLVDKQLSFSYTDPLFYVIGLFSILFIGLFAGSYPAFYLSSFRPVQVLKGVINVGKNAVLPRKVLVTLQFSFSIILIIGTVVIYRQLQFVKERPVGYSHENLIQLNSNAQLIKNFDAFEHSLLESGAVLSICRSSSPVTDSYSSWGDDQIIWPGKTKGPRKSIDVQEVSYNYTSTIGATIIKGRDFSKDFPSDSAGVVLNEAAVKIMNLKDPIGQEIRIGDDHAHIIGVVNDIVTKSPYRPVDPALFFFQSGWLNAITIRLNPEKNLKEEISTIKNIYEKYSSAFPFEYEFVDEDFNKKFQSEELIGKLANLFAFFAIFISCLGLFGLAAFAAEQRKKEIGIRKTLGASVSQITSLLSVDFIKLVAVSFLIASPIGYLAMNKWLENYPYRTEVSWWIFVFAGGIVISITIVTVSYQAIKAAIANPVKSLRTK